MISADGLAALAADDGLASYAAAQLRAAVLAAQAGDAEAFTWLRQCGLLHVELLARDADAEAVHHKLLKMARGLPA